MKSAPIAEQLGGLGLISVGGALEFAALDREPGRLPQGFVVFETERAGPNRLASGAVDQKVEVDFAVVLILDAAARKLAKIDEALDDLERAVIERIAGWTHPEATSPATYVGARTLSVSGQAVSRALTFRTAYHLRKVK